MAQSSAYAVGGYVAKAAGAVSITAVSAAVGPSAIASASGFSSCLFVSPSNATPTMYVYDGPDQSHGIGGPNGQAKHVTPAYCSWNGKVYFNGGDVNGITYTNSSRQETWSLDCAAFRAAGGGNTGWTQEYPYDGATAFGASSVQPKYPDTCGFAFDTTRNIFWFTVPYQYVLTGGTKPPLETYNLSSDANFIYEQHMKFDPKEPLGPTRWSISSAAFGPTGLTKAQARWHTSYDPQTDSLYVFDGTNGSLNILRCATETWEHYEPTGLKNPQMSNIAVDLRAGQRKIYVNESFNHGHFYSVSLDSPYTVTDLGPVPGGIQQGPEQLGGDACTLWFWDSLNNVIVYSRDQAYSVHGYVSDVDRILYVYDPATATWEYFPVNMSPDPGANYIWTAKFGCFVPSIGATLFLGWLAP